jgi:hypothetical protein
MSEGVVHIRLVEATLVAIKNWIGEEVSYSIWADHSSIREYAPPFKMGGVQADIVAINRDTKFTVVGEAKTRNDIDNLHTRKQLKDYFEYLAVQAGGLLWFSVPAGSGGEALNVTKSVRRQSRCERVELIVSEWLLGKAEGYERRWHG